MDSNTILYLLPLVAIFGVMLGGLVVWLVVKRPHEVNVRRSYESSQITNGVPAANSEGWGTVAKGAEESGQIDEWQLAVTMCRHHFEGDMRNELEYAIEVAENVPNHLRRRFWVGERVFMVAVVVGASPDYRLLWPNATVWKHGISRV